MPPALLVLRRGLGTLLGVAAGLLGCGGAPQRASVRPRPVDLGLLRAGHGNAPDQAVIARPTGSMLLLSLWIDAGSRAADPPQIATLAAWLAQAAGGPALEARAWPDAVELTTPCRATELEACLGRLARAVSSRAVTTLQLTGAQQRLADARRGALAADPQREADELALEALYGERAAELLPLGRAKDDGDARLERVQAYVARYFGAGRLLLVAVGELDAEQLAAGAAKAFARLPHATEPRNANRSLPPAHDGVRVGVDDKPGLSIAIAAKDLGEAHAASVALQRRIERDALASNVRGHVFELEGGALALLRADAREPWPVVRSIAHELARLRHEGMTPQPLPAPREDLRALSRKLAVEWAAAGSRPEAQLALGVGVLVSGGRGDRVHADDPDAQLQQSLEERAEAALKAGLALGEPRIHGDSDDQRASVTLDSRARIEVRQRAGEHVAIALRFAGGAGVEPPLLHGRAALLATLSTTACAGLGDAELTAELNALGARLEPRVDAESWGMLLTAPASNWHGAVALALDCALHPALDRAALTGARLRLRERLGPILGRGALRASAAEVLWPSAPGLLAPWGSPLRQAAVSLPMLRELAREGRRGDAVTLAVVGPMRAREVVDWAARRLCELPEEAPPASSAPAQPAPSPSEAPRPIVQPSFGLALWRTTSAGLNDAAGATGFAALMRAALSRGLGVTSNWHDGGITSEGGWAAVAVAGSPEQLAGIALQLREVASGLAPENLERAADQAFDLAERERGAMAASPSAEAETLARAAFHPLPSEGPREAARALAARLAQAEPIWLPLK